jgi:hypothetical protein
LKVTIPANTHAHVLLPAIKNATVTEGKRTVQTTQEGANYAVEVGSGTYEFKVVTP